jgi:hypothetical protein
MVLPQIGSALISTIITILAIGLVIFIVFKLGKTILRIVFGVIANSILGFIVIFLLNYLFDMGIIFTIPVLVSVALFGLPAVGTIVILKLLGGGI